MPVVNRIAGFAEELTAWRRWLHRHPELTFDLPQTTGFVAERLREMGVDEVHEGIGRSGIVAVIEGRGPGGTVGLRADMDALPITEATGADWASETPGQMHACGHDAHTTMLLGAARYLAETRNFAGRAVCIFQPAEEAGGGAEAMLADGLIERFGIEEVYALHVGPQLPEGQLMTRPGPLMAGAAEFVFRVTGRGGHAANPHKAIDPIPALLALGQALKSIPARNRAPGDMMALSVTQIEAGTASNVIPESGWLGGTLRTYDEAVQEMALSRMDDIGRGIGLTFGVEVELEIDRSIAPTVNDAGAVEFAVRVAEEIVGADMVDADAAPRNGGEDFGAMLARRPGAFFYLGQGDGPYLHDPRFDANDATLPIGASFFARLVERRQPL